MTSAKMNPWLCLLIMAQATLITAQVPIGQVPSKPILFKGGTIHTGTGQVLSNGLLAIADGKISLVAQAGSRIDETSYQVVDVDGSHIYPGFILASVALGLVEVGAVRATVDDEERGDLNPNVRTLVAYNTDSELIPTLRFNGITHVQSMPTGGLISGTSSIMALDGWNWEDSAYLADDGIHLTWPSHTKTVRNPNGRKRIRKKDKAFDQKYAKLEKLFQDAAVYKPQLGIPTNLKLAAMAGLYNGKQTLYIHTNAARSMVESIKAVDSWGVKRRVIVGGNGALEIQDFLKQRQVSLILRQIHRLPRTDGTEVNGPYKMPARLAQAGIPFCLGYDSPSNSRNLPFVAGTAAAWGLGKEAALTAITLSAAKILGIEQTTGSLEQGKDANLFISKGDALDMRTNNLTHLFIRGREVPLRAMQQRLYERYHQKYAH